MAGILYQPKTNRNKNPKINALLNDPVTGRALIQKLMTQRRTANANATVTVGSGDNAVTITVKELGLGQK